MSRVRKLNRPIVRILPLFPIFFSAPAWATNLFVESSFGLSQLRSASALFETEVPSPLSLGFAAHFGLFYNTGNGRSPTEFQFGIQPRLGMGSDGGTTYGLASAFGVLRVQLSVLYFSGGLSPLNWKQGGAGGSSTWTAVSSSFAYFGEGGILWPLTPDFSLGLAGAVYFLKGPAGISPSLSTDYTMTMRFYFAHSGKSGSERSSNEFKGWRYPFGMIP